MSSLRKRLPVPAARILNLGGSCYRKTFGRFINCKKMIGSYGPYRLIGEFTFSDFRNWGDAHNGIFERCIDSARKHNCFIDVGAHIGLVTLPVATVMGDNSTIVAIEPSEANRSALIKHLRMNNLEDRVTIIDNLIGNKQGMARFTDDTRISGMSGMTFQEEGVQKPMRTLDDICIENGLKPDLIKIDVEGAELKVLEGALNTLASSKPILILSVHPRQMTEMGDSTERLIDFLKMRGYVIKDLIGNVCHNIQFGEYWVEPV